MQAAQIASGYIMAASSAGVPAKKIEASTMVATDRHRIGFEQVGGHAGAIADIVADIVGDRRRVARIVLGDAGFDLADEIGADVGALGEDAAAEAGEDRDQRRAEAERDQRVDRRRGRRRMAERRRSERRNRPATPRSARPATSRPVTAPELEGDVEAAGERFRRRLRGAHVGAHRDVHADEAGGAARGWRRSESRSPPSTTEEAETDEDRRCRRRRWSYIGA